MSDINTGGPAFPTNDTHTPEKGWSRAKDGMTLRDYFAAKAMQADMIDGVHEDDFPQTAARSYKMADAMLKARKL